MSTRGSQTIGWDVENRMMKAENGEAILYVKEPLKDSLLFLLATEERRTPRAEKLIHRNLNTSEKVLPMVTLAPLFRLKKP